MKKFIYRQRVYFSDTDAQGIVYHARYLDFAEHARTEMARQAGLSGLAGAGWMMSEKFHYTLDFSGSPGLGWDGMLVSLLGGHSPVGVIIAAVLYAALKTGADNINMYSTVPKEIVSVVQALIVLFLAAKFIDERLGVRKQISEMLARRKAAKAGEEA